MKAVAAALAKLTQHKSFLLLVAKATKSFLVAKATKAFASCFLVAKATKAFAALTDPFEKALGLAQVSK